MTAPLPPQERLGVAVVGVGELTMAELLPAFRLSGRARLAAFVTGDPSEVQDLAREHGLRDEDVYTYDDFERLGERADVQAVYLVTPNSLHRQYTERAARLGLHVLCEKPMASNVEDAEAMVRACRDAQVKLMVAYRIQYTPHHWTARNLIQGGDLGRVRLLDSVNGQMEDDPHAWRLKRDLAGGGPLPDIGLYCLNTIRFLLGTEPEEVVAFLHQPEGDERFEEVEESLSWLMRFPDGVLATCSASYNVHTARYLRGHGEKGGFNLDPAFAYQGLRLSVERTGGREELGIPEPDQFTLELDHFAWCVQEDKTPFTPGEEGLQDQRLMDAVYRSAREGRPVQVERFAGRDVFRGERPEGQS